MPLRSIAAIGFRHSDSIEHRTNANAEARYL